MLSVLGGFVPLIYKYPKESSLRRLADITSALGPGSSWQMPGLHTCVHNMREAVGTLTCICSGGVPPKGYGDMVACRYNNWTGF